MREQMVWQPIATAPLGRRILLFVAMAGGHIKIETGVYSTDPYRGDDDEVIGAEEGFKGDGDQCIPSNQEVFTHWMPLPDPPIPQQENNND